MKSIIAASIFALATAYQQQSDDDIVTFGPKAVPDFAAGLVYGFTEENDLPEYA